jgi:four helix bundle protein
MIDMNKIVVPKKDQKEYDLENRTLKFTKDMIKFTKNIPINMINNEILKQVIRSSGSIGANYIEANESLSKKDFIMRIKICRKEAKETAYWLKVLDINKLDLKLQCEHLYNEAIQLKKIFSAIDLKSK